MRIKSLIIATVLLSGTASAQWMPVSGHIVTRTEVLGQNGSVSSKWTTTSQYSRSSSGSTLVQRIGRSGKPASATLLDYGNTQKEYSLSYQSGRVTDTHHAVDHQFIAHPPTGLSPEQKKVSLGNDKVNGVDCFIVPIYEVGINRTRVLIGKAWLAPAYNNLVMREDVIRTSPFGSKKHMVREFTITNQKEPEPSLFSTDHKVVASHWKVATPGN